jgi:hypothetical protein
MLCWEIRRHTVDQVVELHEQAIRNWLEDNVGKYYGMDTVVGSDRAIGSGWEFGTSCESDDDGNLRIGWVVEIADEQLALMFMLRFG